MLDKLDGALRFHQEALNLRAERQQVLANNIANADTPHFKARDFDFANALESALKEGRPAANGMVSQLATTSSLHLQAQLAQRESMALLYRTPEQPSLDGNTVDMDRERTEFTDNAVKYQASLMVLTSRIQGIKTALQPE